MVHKFKRNGVLVSDIPMSRREKDASSVIGRKNVIQKTDIETEE